MSCRLTVNTAQFTKSPNAHPYSRRFSDRWYWSNGWNRSGKNDSNLVASRMKPSVRAASLCWKWIGTVGIARNLLNQRPWFLFISTPLCSLLAKTLSFPEEEKRRGEESERDRTKTKERWLLLSCFDLGLRFGPFRCLSGPRRVLCTSPSSLRPRRACGRRLPRPRGAVVALQGTGFWFLRSVVPVVHLWGRRLGNFRSWCTYGWCWHQITCSEFEPLFGVDAASPRCGCFGSTEFASPRGAPELGMGSTRYYTLNRSWEFSLWHLVISIKPLWHRESKLLPFLHRVKRN